MRVSRYSLSKTINLMCISIVLHAEPISFMDTPVVQSVREEKDALIRCMVKGDPEPTVSWYYNGMQLNRKSLNALAKHDAIMCEQYAQRQRKAK